MQPNMTQTARAVQNQGRYGDSMLVHMTPREVGGLQALAMAHGGSLTINPKTGLPEANFLESILPTLLGVGGMFLGIPPHLTALAVGGIQTARTGDIGKGLLAGLGAYGGANLAGGLQSAGTAANAANAANVANTTNAVNAASGLDALGNVTNMTDVASLGLGDPGLATQTIGTGSALQPLSQTASNAMTQADLASIVNQGDAAAKALSPYEQFTTGFKSVFDTGPTGQAARNAFMGNVGGVSGLAQDVGMAAAPVLLAQPEAPKIKKEKSTYEGPYVPTPREVRFPTAEERQALGTSEFTYFTPSNPVPGFQPLSATQTAQPTQSRTPSISTIDALMAAAGVQPMRTEEERRQIAALGAQGFTPYKEGGLAALARGRKETRKGMPPRFLAGGGDGMSDSIPAVINGNQPARLADGEFVVPADVVSHLGNGSSKAGAKKLYAMMDRVRKARTGKKRQAPEINMNRMMPA
jgi:hypothetical protein